MGSSRRRAPTSATSPTTKDCGTQGHPLCVKDLKPEEAALLAGMVANPSAYDPVSHPQAATRRRNLVLKDMFDEGLISRLEYFNARQESPPAPVDIKPPTVRTAAHPTFTTWVRQQLVDRFGARRAFEGGLKIRTTLTWTSSTPPRTRSASTCPTPTGRRRRWWRSTTRTAKCGRWSGGRDYAQRPFNLATQGQRQPGSSFKPVHPRVRLKKGYGPGSVWPSRKRVFTVPGTKGREKFVVNNFESKYAGSQTLAGGLTFSDNSVYSAVGISVGTKRIASWRSAWASARRSRRTTR
jgi:penicillin-binding protein 1A